MKCHVFHILGAVSVLALSGCSGAQSIFDRQPEDGPVAAVDVPEEKEAVRKPPPLANTAEEFDTTTPEQRAEAAVVVNPDAEVLLGTTIATLGDPAEPGFWLKTPLVNVPTEGRLVYAVTGKSVQVDLIPIEGAATAGSRISLPAMRLLGAPLTGLPELQVFRN